MTTKVNSVIKQIGSKKSLFWERVEARQLLSLFRLIIKKVPAYKDFLKRYKIKTGNIKNIAGFNLLPIINKKDYLRKYPLRKLAVDGRLNKPLIFTSTSGSTGEPFYFHRSFGLDWQASIIHELFFLHGQYKKEEPVLVIICFGMGVWIGGLITYQACRLLQERGYNISLITPGINKEEIFKSLKNLGSEYKNLLKTLLMKHLRAALIGRNSECVYYLRRSHLPKTFEVISQTQPALKIPYSTQ